MWQTKRSPLNALTHTLTFPVNLEGRQGGHLCCGGRAWAAGTVFIITPRKTLSETQSCLIPRCRLWEGNNNKQWKIRVRRRGTFLGPFLSGCAVSRVSLWTLYTNSQLDFCDLRGVILETLWSEKAKHSLAHSQVDGRTSEPVGKTAAQHAYWHDLINNYLMHSFG